MFNTPKRDRDSISPGQDHKFPPFKIVRRSPKERRDEITELIEQYVNPIKRELDEKGRELNELREEILELKNIKTGISEQSIAGLRHELKVRNIELEKIKQELKEMKGIKTEVDDMHLVTERLIDQQKTQERFNRRGNVRMKGFVENRWETKEDCKKNVVNMLQQAGIKLPLVAIEFAHRAGTIKSKYKHENRYILVKFLHMGDKNNVMQRRQQILNKCNIMLEEDFSPEVDAMRKELEPIIKDINIQDRNGKNKHKASLWQDKLLVDGKQYTVDTLDQLPPDISTEKLATPRSNNMVAFFTKHSPLSNYYESEELVDGKMFRCQEQYYTYNKAKTFGDQETAQKIMKEQNPAVMKQLGKHVAGFNHDTWNNRKVDVMRRGLKEKFRNEYLREYLLGTKNAILMEANPYDKFWGVGLSKYSPAIWKKMSWVGKAQNMMGQLLHELRTELNREDRG